MYRKYLLLGLILAMWNGGAQAEESVPEKPRVAEQRAADALASITPEQWAALVAHRVEEASERLQLSEEQQKQLKPIIAQQVEKLRGLAEKHRGASRLELISALREVRDLRSETESRIAPLLTETQQAEARKMREERQAQMRERMQALRSQDNDAIKKLLFPELNEGADEKS